jgi:hypothetical protein
VRGHFVAYLALFFALGGTSIAAVNALPRNSVGTPQLKNGAVTKQKIAKKTIASLRGLRGPRGLTGAAGAAGAAGAKGDTGAPGRSALTPLQHGETEYGTIGAKEDVTSGGVEAAGNAQLPIPAPAGLTDNHVNVAGGADDVAGTCTGTFSNPTAAPGYVCIYPYYTEDTTLGDSAGYLWGANGDGTKWGFQLSIFSTGAGSLTEFANWAYSAP